MPHMGDTLVGDKVMEHFFVGGLFSKYFGNFLKLGFRGGFLVVVGKNAG
jgi:hypothetical protein